jgi:hypothetical protein
MKASTSSHGASLWKDLTFALLLLVFWLFMFLGNTYSNMSDLLEDSGQVSDKIQQISLAAVVTLILCGAVSLRALLMKDGETNKNSGIMMLLATLLHVYFAWVLLDGGRFFYNFGL